MYDKVIIKNLKVFARHGVTPEEKRDGQTFFVDLKLYVDLTVSGVTDNVEDTVNYDEVCDLVYSVMTENTYNLIERTAHAVCDAIFERFTKVEHIVITLKKPEAPVKHEVEYVAVELSANRSGGEL